VARPLEARRRRTEPNRDRRAPVTAQPHPAHHGRAPFASHTSGPMRRDYAINRFRWLAAQVARS